jgi:lysophospholipid acyltransferase (LPLAT)-like uncharacterized protein
MRARILDLATLRKIFSVAASSSLLVALLAPTLVPHVHVSTQGAPALHAANADARLAAPVVETSGCVACRASSLRIGIKGRGVSILLLAREPGRLIAPDATRAKVSHLVRAAAPPRAPPA